MTEPILEIENLSISFFTKAGEIPAVMDFSCKVMPGEAMGIVGESGCGKSTVALGIMRDMGNRGRIVGGTVKFKGRDMGKMSDEELRSIRGSQIAMIYQEPMASLNPAMKIGQQLMEVPIIHEGVSKEDAWKRALDMVAAVKLPDPERMLRSYPHQLSGGQQQRIVIAMALLSKPALLLLDEPTTALDVTVEAGIVQLVKELGRKFGTSMLFISHNLGLILETCDRITVMYSGEAVEAGSVKDVFDRMRHPYTQGLFRSIPLPGADKNSRPLIAIPGQLPLPHQRPKGCNFGPRCMHFEEGLCNSAEIHMHAVSGHDRHESRCLRFDAIDWAKMPDNLRKSEPVKPGKTVLKIDNLRKYYSVAANAIFGGGEARVVKANETLSLEARESETVAIVGESGCGKSTLAKVLMGLETASGGAVMLDGTAIESVPIQSRKTGTISSIQMVFQNPFDTLNPSQSVGSQIIRTLEKFKIGGSVEARSARMLELLDLVKLPRAFAERMPRQLSGGQKQRIGVARAFAGMPKVVVADEPVSALDVSVQAAVTELLMDIQRKSGTTMLFISHDLSVVRYIADRVVVMYLGHIVEQGTTEAVFSPPYHPYTEALLAAIPIADTSVIKKHIVLDGDIPSAMNPPPGCPFQTRCLYKNQVPGGLCEKEVPEHRNMGNGHFIKCHLSAEIFAAMEPVISFAKPDKDGDQTASLLAAAAAVGGLEPGPNLHVTKPVYEKKKRASGDAVRAMKMAEVPAATTAKAKSPEKPKASVKPLAKAEAKPAAAKQTVKEKPAVKAKPETKPQAAAKAPAAPKASAAAKSKPAAKPDDLAMIAGIGPQTVKLLAAEGVTTFRQVAGWTKKDVAAFGDKLRFPGRIESENWIAQAKALAKGGEAEYVRVFGKKPR